MIKLYGYLDTELMTKIHVTDRSITSIIKNNNREFYQALTSYFSFSEISAALSDQVTSLKTKIAVCKEACVKKSLELLRKYKKQKQIKLSLDLIEKAKEKYSKMIKFCQLDIINANQDELPEVYEVLVLSFSNFKKSDPELDNTSIKRSVLAMILERIEIIKKEG